LRPGHEQPDRLRPQPVKRQVHDRPNARLAEDRHDPAQVANTRAAVPGVRDRDPNQQLGHHHVRQLAEIDEPRRR
jgi:hypothetical protein